MIKQYSAYNNIQPSLDLTTEKGILKSIFKSVLSLNRETRQLNQNCIKVGYKILKN